jgi:uncharacterized membrane protein YhiD involved in acid resistance
MLSKIYFEKSTSFSDRQSLSRIFVPLGLITLLVITVVKSSLALSLGLVGALSIVRFRTPIKEPEDLVYIFISIGIGLSLGAGAWTATLIGSLCIFGFLFFRGNFKLFSSNNPNLILSLNIINKSEKEKDLSINAIIKILEPNCKRIDLHRLEENSGEIDVSFNIEFYNDLSLDKLSSSIRKLSSSKQSVRFTVLDTFSGKIL